MPTLISIKNRTSRIFRFKTPWEYVVPKDHDIIVVAAVVEPGPKYEPPTGGDRWGMRDDIYRGMLVVRMDTVATSDNRSDVNTCFSAPVLSLMDASWRLSHVGDEYPGVPKLDRLFEYLDTCIHAGPTAAGVDALKQALDAATMARTQYTSSVMEPATMKIPMLVKEGGKIIVEHRGEMLYGGSSGLPDLVDEPLAVEMYVYQSVLLPNSAWTKEAKTIARKNGWKPASSSSDDQ
jgi:hypothetical protein